MVAPYVLSSSYSHILSEVDKPVLPEVFRIDDLLDFSNEDIGGPIVGGQLQLSGVTVESSATGAETSICCSSSLEMKAEQASSTLEHVDAKTDLCVPCDDLADLEWLSSFVEDSFTMGNASELLSTCGGFGSVMDKVRTPSPKMIDPYDKSSPTSVLENSATSSELTGTDYTGNDYRDVSVPGRARSKRSRTGARIWTSRILPSSSSVNSFESMGTDSYAISFSPIVSEAASGDSAIDVVDQDDDDSQSSKRCKLASSNQSYNQNSHNSSCKGRKKSQDNAQPWRCMHCQTQRTPQWRTGPMGPKTLCNACGVRYKSGRLLPEYRPAASPTYIASKHSHSHKKVLEMRREQEMHGNQNHPQAQRLHEHNQQGAIPLREKTPNQEFTSKNSSVEYPKVEFQSFGAKNLDIRKCFTKPMEMPKLVKHDEPKFGTSMTGLKLPKCLTSTITSIGQRDEYGVADSCIRENRGLLSP